MGRFTPAWASGLLAACVLLGLAFVSVAPAEQPSHAAKRPVALRPVAVVKPVHARVATTPVDGNAAVRTAVARNASSGSCRAGQIALTFDDGPNPAVTAKLVRTLLKLKVPATFFMIGEHVDAHPALARYVASHGFTIGNHTWNHPVMTDLTAKQIRHQLHATAAAFRHHHIAVSHLMRPPYGAINGRVRKVIRDAGLIPVLWTIDSRDWAGGGSSTIAARILDSLRPHRTNLVLQHDGVDNSPASLAAVPIVVKRARARGYCFTRLSWNGGVGGAGAPRTAKRIVPAGSTATSSSTTAVRAAAAPTRTETKAERREQALLLFTSRAALRMNLSAYLRDLATKVPLRRHHGR
ncbi:polysaccharide deacetylase family protein [Nocardioides marmorisolisilvae]|uniref:Polysaccharide deacetylase family protein n=1 Tax=Nocardioides marmorisolisilvae TaxID=1542737 RepID=A0A3N0E0H7_9ACTN|nr:polysaccharide deacetylase family protein [Nocardioides marmorisolisilvae]RNL81351.1 polysaccharide deacetylase family protein [Nocardioides marmorisolisilvae]